MIIYGIAGIFIIIHIGIIMLYTGAYIDDHIFYFYLVLNKCIDVIRLYGIHVRSAQFRAK